MSEPVTIELINARSVKRMLRCSLPWVYKAADAGVLPCVRIPCPGKGDRQKSMVRFKQEDVLNFIESHYSRA